MSDDPSPTVFPELRCEVPGDVHGRCAEALRAFLDGEATAHAPAYVCNMVDSRLIPLTECLIREYAEGVLLNPFALW